MNETNMLFKKIIERLDFQSIILERLQTDVTELKETQLKHSDLLSQLVKGQIKQDKIIQNLATRSLEQESDILEFKSSL